MVGDSTEYEAAEVLADHGPVNGPNGPTDEFQESVIASYMPLSSLKSEEPEEETTTKSKSHRSRSRRKKSNKVDVSKIEANQSKRRHAAVIKEQGQTGAYILSDRWDYLHSVR